MKAFLMFCLVLCTFYGCITPAQESPVAVSGIESLATPPDTGLGLGSVAVGFLLGFLPALAAMARVWILEKFKRSVIRWSVVLYEGTDTVRAGLDWLHTGKKEDWDRAIKEAREVQVAYRKGPLPPRMPFEG
jgi:hypothetical protein